MWHKGELQDAPDDVCHVALYQREARAMFLEIVASDGKMRPIIRVPTGIKVNATVYQDLLKQQVHPWIDANYTPGTWVWQQDATTAHTVRSTQMLGEEGQDYQSKTEWPPSSPDCASLDYSMWDHVVSVACRDTAPNVATLKEHVNVAWENMDAKFIHREVQEQARSCGGCQWWQNEVKLLACLLYSLTYFCCLIQQVPGVRCHVPGVRCQVFHKNIFSN